MSETTTATTEATVTPQRTKGAPKASPATKKATAKKDATPPKKSLKKQPVVKAKKAEGATPDGSKKAIVLAMLRRPKGATLDEIIAATQWRAHSVRGFISGAVGRKLGLKVESTRRDDGARIYRIA